jgi:taurine dioxygenase
MLSSHQRIGVFLATLVALTGISLAAVVKVEDVDLSAPWFGAFPPSKGGPYPFHRRGWEACIQCGGAERLGAIVHVGNVSQLTPMAAGQIIDAVRAHGVIVIKNQNMTRAQQVAFTDMLGDVVTLPSSFEGQDPEPFQPAIQRITNFWANGTWKGSSAKLGAYWHR